MDAREKLQQHLDMLFSAAPRSRAVYELQEELMTNSMERYSDLIRTGMPEQQALDTVIGGIGNVDELINALPETDRIDALAYAEERRAKSAITVTVAVGLYILAGVALFVGIFASTLYNAAILIGLIIAAILCIAPTCMLVYNAYRWPSYKKQEDTVVEDFKKWNNDTKKRDSLRGAVSSVMWTLIVVAYFAISFLTGAWAYTWMIFLVGACLETVTTLIFKVRDLR